MISDRRTISKIVCFVLIFFVVATVPLEGICSSLVQGAELSSRQEAPGRAALEESLPLNTIHNYTLAIDNVKCAAPSYGISDRQMAGGVAVADIGEGLSQMVPASMVLEIPLESKPVELKNTGLAATGWQDIMSENFEGVFPTGLWVAYDGDGAINGEYYWDDDDYKPHWGSGSAWCANGGANGLDPQFYYYPHNMDAHMVYGPFSLVDATDAELNFYQWSDTEFDYDYLWWTASIDGVNFYGWWYTGYSDGWISESFDLTDVYSLGNLCGESQVWIAFRFESDGTYSYDGAFIDDIVLRKYVGASNNPPYTPSTPSPANHATGVSINADFSWSGGDPDVGDTVTYDVYFGTSSSPPLVSDNQVATTYDPGTLAYNTKYYWYILAMDNHGAPNGGPIWDFTTSSANNPPNMPGSPSPMNHAAGVSTDADVSWAGGDPDAGDTVTYDVYFGTSATPPLVSDDQPGTAYDPGTLAHSTNYYWKIIATDNHAASTTGPVWDFTTQAQPNNPPYTPSNPSPANHATGVSISTDLVWMGGDSDAGDTVTYDVYFGISASPPLVSNNQGGTSYAPGTLTYSTKYYWQIVARDNHGMAVGGPVWDLTTQPQPAEPTDVQISPPGQEVTCGGSFSVNVTVDPQVAIAGVQFNLSFDPSLLTANGVTEGNLLKQAGASTFFQAGTINNGAGTVTGVAGAIITPGASVSGSGTFVTISFTTKTTEGTSALDLYDVIVGNPQGQPASITVSDGSVTVRLDWDDWDVNCDLSVNVLDMILVGMHWGESGAAHWIRQDVNRDGAINVLDMIPIGQHWTG